MAKDMEGLQKAENALADMQKVNKLKNKSYFVHLKKKIEKTPVKKKEHDSNYVGTGNHVLKIPNEFN